LRLFYLSKESDTKYKDRKKKKKREEETEG